MSLTIETYPAKVLSKPARRIRQGDGIDLHELREQMAEALREYVGVGLAAPQVGKSIRFILAEDTRTGEIRDFVNPQITQMSQECDVGAEGCLSFPGLVGDVVRAKGIRVHYQDKEFNDHEEEFTGFYARVLQHEIDHLNGVLLIDRAEDGLRDAVPEVEEEAGDGDDLKHSGAEAMSDEDTGEAAAPEEKAGN